MNNDDIFYKSKYGRRNTKNEPKDDYMDVNGEEYNCLDGVTLLGTLREGYTLESLCQDIIESQNYYFSEEKNKARYLYLS